MVQDIKERNSEMGAKELQRIVDEALRDVRDERGAKAAIKA